MMHVRGIFIIFHKSTKITILPLVWKSRIFFSELLFLVFETISHHFSHQLISELGSTSWFYLVEVLAPFRIDLTPFWTTPRFFLNWVDTMGVSKNDFVVDIKNKAWAIEAVKAKLNYIMDDVITRMDGFETKVYYELRALKEFISALITSLLRKEDAEKCSLWVHSIWPFLHVSILKV